MARRQIDKEQFFTRPDVIDRLAKVIIDRCGDDFTYVDSSCGAGYLPHLLNEQGIQVYAYDIDISNDRYDIAVEKDWLSITRDNKEFPDNSVVGFNPPFGYQGNLARKFIRHAAYLCPDAPYLFFIAPNLGPNWSPDGFVIDEIMKLDLDVFEYPTGGRFSAPSAFYIFKPGERIKLETVAAPDGFSMVTLASAFNLAKGKRLERELLPIDEDKLIIRKGGGGAGKTAIAGVDGELRFWSFNAKEPVDKLYEEEDLGADQYNILTVPDEWSGNRRKDLLRGIASLLGQSRANSANKLGVNRNDILTAIQTFIEQRPTKRARAMAAYVAELSLMERLSLLTL